MQINREDMLLLTRRMTPKRTSITRIAGCYVDSEGFIDGTFNTDFLKLSPSDKEKNLALAKAIPFAKTNEELKRENFRERNGKRGIMAASLGYSGLRTEKRRSAGPFL